MRIERVEVSVPARLHLGFLDLEGGLGRRFGSLGLALDQPSTRLAVTRADGLHVEGPDAERARDYLEKSVAHFGLEGGFRLQIETAIPPHSGLGSGTQLALAVGVGVCRASGLEVTPREIAGLLDRGARSGIGLGSFEQGGLLLDGGIGRSPEPPPILSRLPFPEHWRLLLILDRAGSGLAGLDEAEAFRHLPPFPAERAAALCRLVVMSALPAVAEADLASFGAAVTELQRVIGDHFAPAQGGRFASPRVAEALAWLEAERVAGFGQSSWGPTGFAVLGSAEQAVDLATKGAERWPEATGLQFLVCRGRNSGAKIQATEAVPAVALRR